MINEEKIRLMTRIAFDEEKDLKESVEDGKYYRSDYVLSRVLKLEISVSFAFVMGIVLLALYNLEDLFINIVRYDYKQILFVVFMTYLGIILVVGSFSIVYYSLKYRKQHQDRKNYLQHLEALEEFYESKDEDRT